MMYGLLNFIVSGGSSTTSPDGSDSDLATCSDYLDPNNEDRKDFEAKLDAEASH
jgi:hypothetical protein